MKYLEPVLKYIYYMMWTVSWETWRIYYLHNVKVGNFKTTKHLFWYLSCLCLQLMISEPSDTTYYYLYKKFLLYYDNRLWQHFVLYLGVDFQALFAADYLWIITVLCWQSYLRCFYLWFSRRDRRAKCHFACATWSMSLAPVDSHLIHLNE